MAVPSIPRPEKYDHVPRRPRGEVRASPVAKVAPIEDEEITLVDQGEERLVDVERVNRNGRFGERLHLRAMLVPHLAELVEPREIAPRVLRGFGGHPGGYVLDIPYDSDGDLAVAPNLHRRRVDLDDLGIRRDGRRARVADDDVLLHAEQKDDVGLAQLAGCSIEPVVVEARAVRVLVRHQPARRRLGHQGNAGRFDEALEWCPRSPSTTRRSRR